MQVPAPKNADKMPNRAGVLLTCIKLHLSSTAPAKTVIRYSYLVVTGNEFSHQSLVLMASAMNIRFSTLFSRGTALFQQL